MWSFFFFLSLIFQGAYLLLKSKSIFKLDDLINNIFQPLKVKFILCSHIYPSSGKAETKRAMDIGGAEMRTADQKLKLTLADRMNTF